VLGIFQTLFNYGILLYNGTSYIDVIVQDFNSRSLAVWIDNLQSNTHELLSLTTFL
jgi:hypothetical protein